MAGRGQAVVIGPFNGGLNTELDPTSIANTELATCENFLVEQDGSLVQRPPIVEVLASGAWTTRLRLIGNAYINGVSYLIGSCSDGVYAWDGTSWSLVVANVESYCALQYRDLVYVIPKPGSVAAGGYWKPGAGWATDVSMPEGISGLFYKARLFVTPGDSSRLTFSDVVTADLLTWSGTNFIDVNPGDGQTLNDIVIMNDNLLLFKNDSTYVLAYDIRPEDAVLRVLSTRIGVADANQTVQYESLTFIYHEDKVFSIQDYEFIEITVKLDPVYDTSAPATRLDKVFLTLLGTTLIFRYHNRIYAFGIESKAWTEWKSLSPILHNFGPLVEYQSDTVPVAYYAGSAITGVESIFRIYDDYDATVIEETLAAEFQIECKIDTKTFDFDDPFRFKKLMWWGVDVLTSNDVVGLVTPITTTYTPTWEDLSSYLWDSLSIYRWGFILGDVYSIRSEATYNVAIKRVYVKFRKTLRFRQAFFTVLMTGDGATPCRLFTLSAILNTKQIVPKQVN